jgi:hypothetical protein
MRADTAIWWDVRTELTLPSGGRETFLAMERRSRGPTLREVGWRVGGGYHPTSTDHLQNTLEHDSGRKKVPEPANTAREPIGTGHA